MKDLTKTEPCTPGIAVIGLSGRFPGANNYLEYWENLKAGRSGIEEVPRNRWDWKAYWGDPMTETNKSNSKWGGFLAGVESFDADFFGLSAKEVERMDPQQRIMLELAWSCFEDAGIRPSLVSGGKTGVFLGVFNHDYKELQERTGQLSIEAHHSTGTATAIIANRISYYFNLKGPSLPIDTACSSSLNAIHAAIQSLYSGECRMALAGGINLLLTPTRHISFSKTGMLSPTGSCKTFDDSADGYVRGEGAGLLLLKPLAQALLDDDHIYGIIKGSAVNHGGKTYSLTYPNPDAQQEVITEAQRAAHVDPRTITYIETHGTGTPKGDPIEIRGLLGAFRNEGTEASTAYCGLGSVKTNIGHLEAAAGIAGVIKVLLSMKHSQLPGLANFKQLNHRISLQDSPFYLVTSLTEWNAPVDRDGNVMPRRAGVSSFGFGGTNAHVVLEEAPACIPVKVPVDLQLFYLICLSACTEENLLQKVKDLADWLKGQSTAVQLADVCRTLAIGREHFPKRVSFIAKDLPDLRDKLTGLLMGDNGADCFRQVTPENEELELLQELSGIITAKLAACPCTDEDANHRMLGTIARLYVRGIDPDWERPWLGSQGRRIALPAYPFTRHHYWMPEADSADRRLHLLLTTNISGASGFGFSSVFTGQEPFLKDHMVKGRKVLPAVVCLEMIRAAIAEAMQGTPPSPVMVFENVIWGQPVLGDTHHTQIFTHLDPQTPDSISFQVTGNSTAGVPEAAIYSSGSARLSEPYHEETVDISSIREKAGQSGWTKEECYRRLSRMGFRYGPSHQALEGLWDGNGQSVAFIRSPADNANTAHGYVLHPGLMDAAWQAALLSCTAQDQTAPDLYLPFALDRLEVLRPCTPEMWALITNSSGPALESMPVAMRRVHLALYDQSGQICVRVTHLSFRKAIGNDISLLQPEWMEEPVEAGATTLTYNQHIVFLCQTGDSIPEEWHHQLPDTNFILLPASGSDIGQVYMDYTLSVFEAIRTLLKTKPGGRMLAQVVIAGPAENDIFLGLSGLLRSARRENPYFTGQVIRVSATENIPQLLLENASSSRDDQIDHHTAIRQVLRWKEVAFVPRQESTPWKAGGVYLITGGAGGLGLIFAREIAEKVKHPVIILAGRSSLDTAREAAIGELRRTGATVDYLIADATDRSSLEKLIRTIIAGHSRLDGILHGAGNIRDSFIINKTKEEMVGVLAPKVLGTTWLDELTQDLPLDLFILFSSIVASEGNTGQADYAAANAFLHDFAARRNRMVAAGQRHGRTLSVGWPLWREGGMQLPPEMETAFLAQMKMRLLETSEGITSLYRCLLSGYPSLAVIPHAQPASPVRAIPAAQSTPAQSTPVQPTPRTPVPPLSDGVSYKEAVNYFKDLLSVIIKRPAGRIDADTAMEQYGIDSIMVMQMTAELEKVFGVLPKTLFFEYQNIRELTQYFLEHHGKKMREILAPQTAPPAAQDQVILPARQSHPQILQPQALPHSPANAAAAGPLDIAIIGVAGRYPGADNLQEFWDNLCQGKDSITEIPPDRWDYRQYFDADKEKEGRSYSKWGGFIRDVDKFDPLFFNISPLEAERMDPQERLFLQCVYETLEDAGYTRSSLENGIKNGLGRSIGVYAGVMYEEYQLFGAQEALQGRPVALWGLPSSIANRVSYFFDFHGPSMAVDTMCSSSLTAIHLACESLVRGRCELAVAGGVNVSIHPNKYLFLCQGRFASSKGRCESFGLGGDGYVPGEGVGTVLLKPLSRAIEDRDNIYAVIKSTAINHGGKTNGYTVPNPKAQAAVIGRAFSEAGIDPGNIGYFEAHGTGTYLGDPIEIAGLSKAMQEYTRDREFCSIGSVKSNIGHCESAAGIAGLTKILLQMKYRKIVPSLHSQKLNENIDFAASPFYVQQTLSDWQRPAVSIDGKLHERPLCAGISSFGAGGSNAHLIVEEYIPALSPPALSPAAVIPKGNDEPVFIVLSARDEDRLEQRVRQLWTALQPENNAFWQITEDRLADLAFTLRTGREQMTSRLTLSVSSLSELYDRLGRFVRGDRQIQGMQEGPVPALSRTGSLNGQPCRMSLPVYPFRRERYWIGENLTATVHAGAVPYLHPLLHANISDLSAQRFSTHLTGNEFYLADHLIRGKKVLPAAVGLEMVHAAVRRSLTTESGDYEIRLRNISWHLPITVNEKGITLHLELQRDNTGLLDFMVTDGHADPHERDIFFQGKAGMFTADGERERSKKPLDAIRAACKTTFSHPEIYEAFESYGFHYGPSLRGLREIYVGDGMLLARIAPPPATSLPTAPDLQHQWQWPVAWLEPALQATLFWHHTSGNGSGRMFLPVAMEEVEEIRPFGRPGEWALIHGREDQDTHERMLDIDILDHNGDSSLHLRSVTLALAAGPAPLPETLLMKPSWEKSTPAQPDTKDWGKRLIVIVGAAGSIQDTVANTGAELLSLAAPDAAGFRSFVGTAMEKIRLLQKEKGDVLVQVLSVGEGENNLVAAIGGLLKTAGIENPSFFGQLIRLPADPGPEELAGIAAENTASFADRDIRYRNGIREALRWMICDRPAALPGSVATPPWKENGVYLITGGAGGLGLIFAFHIARLAKGVTLILTGRSLPGTATRSKLAELEQLGAKVHYRRMDVTDAAAVKDTIGFILATAGSLNGIIHSAGIIRDEYLINSKGPEWDSVLAPKVDGVIHLDRATAQLALDYFILFSSVTGALGNAGQSNYAVANAFMDEYAAYRNTLVAAGLRQGRTMSINWPLWAEGGMRVGEEVEEYLLNTMGMRALATSSGLGAFDDIIRCGLEQVMVMEGDRDAIIEKVVSKRMPARQSVSAPPDTITGEREALAMDHLKKLFLEVMKLPPDRIRPDVLLEEYGLDSVLIVKLTGKLEKMFGPVSKTLFFEYRSIRELARYFLTRHPAAFPGMTEAATTSAQPVKTRKPITADGHSVPIRPSDIAVVGISGRYPGASNLEEFWENLSAGKDCITEIPADRWDYKLYFDPDRQAAGKTYSKWGGFLQGVDEFDPLFFNISPLEAELLDPQERLFLQCVHETIEDAGYNRQTLGGEEKEGPANIGVYVGVMYSEYQLYGAEESLKGKNLALFGNPSSIANRVSYFYNFSGPSMAVDTMCSSSLSAIHLACRSIVDGECTAAIAGGVNLSLHPNKYLLLAQGKFISGKGRCDSFGAGGDGYVPAEGVGAVLLKPLARAISDGDHIYGVIKATAINHGGRTNGYTVPNPRAQSSVIAAAYRKAGIDPRTISYLEAHGTGTSLGDPIEIKGLETAFRSFTSEKQFCAIGSVKSNIGHAESAAGMAGLTKLILQLQHRKLAPSLHAEELNPNIDFENSPFIVQRGLADWQRPVILRDGRQKEYLRRAGLSSFGAGGANAHLIIEEYPDQTATVRHTAAETAGGEPVIIVLSAKNPGRLKEVAGRLETFLGRHGHTDPTDLAYTLQAGREALEYRLAVIVSSIGGLQDRLRRFLSGEENIEDLYLGRIERDNAVIHAFDRDEELQEALAKWIERKKYRKIGELWIKGLQVDWRLLHQAAASKGIGFRRLSLPPYPFEKERHWVPRGNPVASLPKIPDHPPVTMLLQPYWKPRPGIAPETCAQETRPSPTCLPATCPPASRCYILLVGAELKEKYAGFLRARMTGVHILSFDGGPDVPGHGFPLLSRQLFVFIRDLLRDRTSGNIRIQLVIPARQAVLAALLALLRTARLENPRLNGLLMEIDELLPPEELLLVLQENRNAVMGARVRQKDIRLEWAWNELAIDPERPVSSAMVWKEQGVYLVTGGAGGIGLIFVREIARRCPGSTIILCGRSSGDSTKEQLLSPLRQNGATIEYRQADIADALSSKLLIDGIVRDFGSLTGVIHSAGITRDSHLIRKTEKEWDEVMAPKVDGLLNLDELSRDLPLDFFVLFSSIAAAWGNPGQADYATANAFMDEYARHRNTLVAAGKRQGRTVSINWPLWKEGGMNIGPEIIAELEHKNGWLPLPTEPALAAFYHTIAGGSDQVMVLYGYEDRLRTSLLSDPAEPALRPVASVFPPTASTLPPTGSLRETTLRQLKELFGQVVKLPSVRIDEKEEYQAYGLNSVMIVRLNQLLEKIFGELSKTLFYEYPNLSLLADFLLKEKEEDCRHWARSAIAPAAASTHSTGTAPVIADAPSPHVVQDTPSGQGDEAIAIIGLSGRYPLAPTPASFWDNLRNGRDCITEITPDRWDLSGFFTPDKETAVETGKSYSKWGAFLEDFADFDPLFFNISPREAHSMDPQERIFLQISWAVLEDAGYTRQQLADRYKGKVGVFAGVTKTGFELYGPALSAAGKDSFLRTSFSSVANRVSYHLNLNGPSMPIDTMCSSSLTAVYEACEHLLRGSCELAIAGGVNLYLHPQTYIGLCSQSFLAQDGKCRSFGEGGSGFVPGEGAGAVLLKRLSAAMADKDNIYAVIRSTCVNHGGRTSGYTVPNPVAQATLIRAALDKAGMNARDVSYVEAHGTGTLLGDPIEITGLTRAFRRDTAENRFCAIGSVKSNIGHLEAAAGIAGLTKIVLQMQKGLLAPSLHTASLNPNIDFERSPFYVQKELASWKRQERTIGGISLETPRIACLSSFGAGGSNAHIIVEEFSRNLPEGPRDGTARSAIIVLSARHTDALKRRAQQLLEFLGEDPLPGQDALHNIAYTLQVGREAMEERLAIVAHSTGMLKESLAAYLAGDPSAPDRVYGTVSPGTEAAREHAAAWVKGAAIDWEQWYASAEHPGPQPVRIPLPTYPFRKTRYWLPGEINGSADKQWLFTAEKWESEPLPADTDWQRRLKDQASRRICIVHSGKIDPGPLKGLLEQLARAGHLQQPPVVTTLHTNDIDPSVLNRERPEIILFLGPDLQPDRLPEPPLDPPSAFAEQDIRAIYRLSSSLMQAVWDDRIQLYYQFATDDERDRPDCQALSGFFRSAMKENSQHVWRSIRMHGLPDAAARYRLLVKEWLSEGPGSPSGSSSYAEFSEIIYEGEWRQVRRLTETPLPAAPAPIFGRQKTYLVAGGMGYVGSVLLRQLALTCQPNLAIVSRAAPDEARRKECRELENAGAMVRYFTADITDKAALEEVCRQIRQEWKHIHGVINLTRAHDSKGIVSKSWDSFHSVSRVKVLGTCNLDEVTRHDELDFFLLFASIGAYGARGDSDYAYSAAFQNELARSRNEMLKQGKRTGATVSLCWGPWQIDRLFPESRAKMAALGLDLIDMTSAFPRIEAACYAREPVLGLCAVLDPEKVRKVLGIQQPGDTRLQELVASWEQQRGAGRQIPITEIRDSLSLEDLQEMDPSLVERVYSLFFGFNGLSGERDTLGILRESARAILQVPDIRDNLALQEYGLDSIMAMRLSVDLSRKLKCEVQPKWLLEFPTLAELAKQLDN